jgi:hypothetical protein
VVCTVAVAIESRTCTCSHVGVIAGFRAHRRPPLFIPATSTMAVGFFLQFFFSIAPLFCGRHQLRRSGGRSPAPAAHHALPPSKDVSQHCPLDGAACPPGVPRPSPACWLCECPCVGCNFWAAATRRHVFRVREQFCARIAFFLPCLWSCRTAGGALVLEIPHVQSTGDF